MERLLTPAAPISVSGKWEPDNLIKWGGGVLLFAGLCGLVAYPLAVLYAWLFDRRANPLDIAAHAAYVTGVSALAFALTWLLLSP